VKPDWAGSYLAFDALKPGNAVTLEFPIRETTHSHTINANTDKAAAITCTFRGNTLVDISPRDANPTTYRICRREHLRRDVAPTRTRERWVPEEALRAW
jgi:hypothetical protein